MFGNLISNRQLRQLCNARQLVITNFDEKSVKPSHYTVQPGRAFRRQDDGKWIVAHDFTVDAKYEMQPNEYAIVELRQRIEIAVEGIVGRFITTSNHIEGGLMIVAGQIQHKYGQSGEYLRVGVKNLLDRPNYLSRDTRLAHIEFFDLRGITIDPHELSPVERATWTQRRRDPDGDGPDYSRAE